MAIYQIPTDEVGVSKSFSGTIKDSGNNPIEGAVVVLRRKGGSDYVAYTETNASGNYSFTVDADGDFVVGYKLSHDPNAAITESDEMPSGKSTAWYNVFTTGYYSCLAVADFPGAGGSAASYWVGTPSAKVVDAGPYLLGDAINTYGFTGPGHGAKIAVEMCPIGGGYQWYSRRVELESLYGGIGRPLQHYNVLAIGRDYQSPHFQVSGTTVHLYSGNVEQAREAGFSNAFEYEYNTYYTRPSTMYRSIFGRQVWVYDNDQVISEIESIWGSDRSQWGVYQSDYSGGKFSAAVPGTQDRADFNTTDYDETAFVEALTDPNEAIKHGKQLYYSLIYGPGGIPGTPTGNSSTSAIKAQQAKVISQEELDILKGYFGKTGIVAELTSASGLTATHVANTLNFGYQMTQAITTYLRDVRNNSTDPWDISEGYAGAYSGTNASVFSSIYREWQSFQRQKKGTDIAEADFGTKVYPILQKMGMSTLQTYNGTGWRQWSFSSSGVTSREGL
jgi:hypothetical protein